MTSLHDLQAVLRHEWLHVEYAVNTSGEVFLLQARPLVAASKHRLAAPVDKAFQAARATVAEIDKQAVGISVRWVPDGHLSWRSR